LRREVCEVLGVEELLLVDQSGARQPLSRREGDVGVDIGAEIRQQRCVTADRHEAVLGRGDLQRIE